MPKKKDPKEEKSEKKDHDQKEQKQFYQEREYYKPRRIKRMLEDYEQQEVLNPKTGKYKTIVIYTGKYYCSPYDKLQFRKVKALYACLVVAGTALFLFAALPEVPVNTSRISAIVEAFFLFGALLTICFLLRFLFCPLRMRKEQHRASMWIKIFSMFPSVTGVVLLGIALYYLIFEKVSFYPSFLCGLLFLISAGCFLTVFILEFRTKYTTCQSKGGIEDEV